MDKSECLTGRKKGGKKPQSETFINLVVKHHWDRNPSQYTFNKYQGISHSAHKEGSPGMATTHTTLGKQR